MKLDLFWTSIIVGSIVLAFILPKLFRKSESTTRKIGISVASFWILWTVFGVSQFFVGYAISGPLVIVQTLIILIVFYFSYTRFSEKQKHRSAPVQKTQKNSHTQSRTQSESRPPRTYSRGSLPRRSFLRRRI